MRGQPENARLLHPLLLASRGFRRAADFVSARQRDSRSQLNSLLRLLTVELLTELLRWTPWNGRADTAVRTGARACPGRASGPDNGPGHLAQQAEPGRPLWRAAAAGARSTRAPRIRYFEIGASPHGAIHDFDSSASNIPAAPLGTEASLACPPWRVVRSRTFHYAGRIGVRLLQMDRAQLLTFHNCFDGPRTLGLRRLI